MPVIEGKRVRSEQAQTQSGQQGVGPACREKEKAEEEGR